MNELEELDAGRWYDRASGLVVVGAPRTLLHRVFQTKYSALNPPIPAGQVTGWSRFDVLDHATLYGAEQDVAAVCETLAYAKRATLNLHALFSDVSSDDDPVAEEWERLGHMPPGQIARSWRVARELTTIAIRLNTTGWFVDILHAETIATLRRTAPAWSPTSDLVRDTELIDISLLTGARREVTTAAASWLRRRVLADGSEPDGIQFCSKHGKNLTCWALWVPLHGATDQEEVPSLVGQYVRGGESTPLLESTPALLKAAQLLNVRVH